MHCFIIYNFLKDVLQNIEAIFIYPFALHKLTLIASLMEAVTQRVAESARRHPRRPLSFGSRVPSSTFFLEARPMAARPPGSFEIIGALRYLLIIILCFVEAPIPERSLTSVARNTVEVIYTVNTHFANESRLIWQFSNFVPHSLEKMPTFLRDFNLNSLCPKFNENVIPSLSRYCQFVLGKFLSIKFIPLIFCFIIFNKWFSMIDIYSYKLKFQIIRNEL